MELAKAPAILKLLNNQEQQIRGLREVKKRLFMNKANILVFRKLGLLPIILKLIKNNTKQLQTLFAEKKQVNKEDELDINPDNLEFDDLTRLLHMNDGDQKKESHELIHHESDAWTAELLTYCISLLTVISADYHVKLQSQELGAMSIILPLLHCKEDGIIKRTLKVLSNLLQIPGPNLSCFIKMNGPSLVVHLLKLSQEVELSKILINSIRFMSSCPAAAEEFLKINILETICSIGLTDEKYYVPTAHIISHYAALPKKSSLLQIISCTNELVLLLRIWQDHKENAEFHSYIVRIVQHFVRAAILATHNCNDKRVKYNRCNTIDHQKAANLAPIKDQLVKTLFECKAVLVLVVELINNSGCLSETVLSSLCTLCDGSLEIGNIPGGFLKPGAALAWMQIIEGGGIPSFMSILYRKNKAAPDEEILKEDDFMVSIQKRIFVTFQALENNISIQDQVLKHCLASNLLEILALHFDLALAEYQKFRGNLPLSSSCLHKDYTPGDSCKEIVNNFQTKDLSFSIPVVQNIESIRKVNSEVDLTNRRDNCQSPVTLYPLSPLSSPRSPCDSPPLVYTPYSPPSSPTSSLPSSPEIISNYIRSPSASPLHKPCERRSPSPLGFSSSNYSPIHPGRYSPYSSPTRSPSPTSLFKLVKSSSPPTSRSGNSSPSKFSVFKRERSLSSDSMFQNLPKKLKHIQDSSQHETDPVVEEIRKSRSRIIKATTPASIIKKKTASIDVHFCNSGDSIYSSQNSLSTSFKRDTDFQHDLKVNKVEPCSKDSSTVLCNALENNPQSHSSNSNDLDSGMKMLPSQVKNCNISHRYSNDESNNSKKHLLFKMRSQSTASLELKEESSINSSSEDTSNSMDYSIVQPSTSSVSIKRSSSLGMDQLVVNDELKETGSGVKIREFNHIKFRVGKRNKGSNTSNLEPLLKKVESIASENMSTVGCSEQDISSITKTKGSSSTDKVYTSGQTDVKNRDQCADVKRFDDKTKKTSKGNNSLGDLEAIVRVMAQVCLIKEALNGVCREFLPRIVVYLRYAQSIHKSSFRALLEITKTPCSIPPLMDTLFPAYVGVQLCEAEIIQNWESFGENAHTLDCDGKISDCNNIQNSETNETAVDDKLKTEFKHNVREKMEVDVPNKKGNFTIKSENENVVCKIETSDILQTLEVKNNTTCSKISPRDTNSKAKDKCSQCIMISQMGNTFLVNMSKFFGHVHQYGAIEAQNRLRPNAPLHARDTCLLNLPYVTRCPLLLHSLLAGGGLQEIISIISEGRDSSCPRIIYATAGLFRLASVLEVQSPNSLGNQCEVCLLEPKPLSHYSDSLFIPPFSMKKSDKINEPSFLPSRKCKISHSSLCKWAEKKDKDLKLFVEKDSMFTDIAPDTDEQNMASECTIMAHRSILCKASTVWATMLGGKGWIEDTSNEIKVGGGIGIDCITVIIHYLYGCTNCKSFKNVSLAGYIKLLRTCHMYELPELQDFAADCIVQKCISPENVLLIYNSAVGLINENIITAMLIKFISSSEVPTWKRAQNLCSIAESPHGPDLMHNLYTIFYRALEKNSSNCTCDLANSLYMSSNSVYDRLV